ncbi:hypothetical protein B0T18DRAFT_424217 [Schizothecium vesticola]|uniref:Uncharacterized protein n=1 Tax=Schizothecium vesticola TaxID=314040 RepID=A0AA40F9Q2_9PEZI|nr:hypothetical protein B0T18DRAFT_424217 [Schizothecium vesticola]
MSTSIPSSIAQAQASSTQPTPTNESIGVKHTSVNTVPGVSLSSHQNLLVGSVLDLFQGHPTLKHLSLWSPTATFTDPLSIATGHNRFAAQWYGLASMFRPIELLEHRVVSDKNPIEIEMRTRYTLKAVKKATEISSVVKIWVGDGSGSDLGVKEKEGVPNGERDRGKIVRLEDRWDGKLPEGMFSEAFRKINAMTVPVMVKVPKTEEEDRKMQAEREKE